MHFCTDNLQHFPSKVHYCSYEGRLCIQHKHAKHWILSHPVLKVPQMKHIFLQEQTTLCMSEMLQHLFHSLRHFPGCTQYFAAVHYQVQRHTTARPGKQ